MPEASPTAKIVLAAQAKYNNAFDNIGRLIAMASACGSGSPG
jgi:hypothetical protein